MNPTTQAIIARLAKMKALAIGGVDGEREAAARLIEKVALRHGIDLDTIDGQDEEETLHFLDTPRGWKLALVRQLLALMLLEKYGSVNADHFQIVLRAKLRKGRWCVDARFVRCTNAEFIELQSKFAILSRDFERQRKALFRAFLVANDLLCPYDPDSPPPTAEENALAEDARHLADGIQKSTLLKQLPPSP